MRSLGNRSSSSSSRELEGAWPATRSDQRSTASRDTTLLKIRNTVTAMVRIFPILLGIYRLSWAILGYRSFIQKTPRTPQKTLYSRHTRPFRLKGMAL